VAALRAGLVLSAEQEKHWQAFEQAVNELQQLRLSRITARREARRDDSRRSFDPAERLRQRATRMSETGTVLKKLADATDPLYRSLDDAQRRRFAVLSRMMGPVRPQFRGRDRDRNEPTRQRRTDLDPGKAAGLILAQPELSATSRKQAGLPSLDAATPVASHRTVAPATAEEGIARKPAGTNIKAVGLNQKPSGSNQKVAAEGI
jgi:LTXXQ motif family protein